MPKTKKPKVSWAIRQLRMIGNEVGLPTRKTSRASENADDVLAYMILNRVRALQREARAMQAVREVVNNA